MIDPRAKGLERLRNAILEYEWLKNLSDVDLVSVALEEDASDSMVVQEMMTRLDPDWDTRILTE